MYACIKLLQILLMSINKISIIQVLRNGSYNYLPLEHVIVILLDNAVSIRQARRYLHEKNTGRSIDWSKCEISQLQTIVNEAQSYAKTNYQLWKQEYRRYLDGKVMISKNISKIMQKLQIRQKGQEKESIERLKTKIQQLKHQNRNKRNDQNNEATALIKQIEELIALSIQKESYQFKLNEVRFANDIQFQRVIKQIMHKLQLNENIKEDYQIQVERSIVIETLEKYDQNLVAIKKILYQIFIYYCREHKAVGATFQQFGKYSQLIDLRTFLKYFKDYEFVQHNKFRFKVATVTLLFKNQAKNGITLNFQQFWSVHKKLFQIQSIQFTRQNIVKAERSQLQKMKNKWDQQLVKLNELSEIVNQTKTKQLFTFINVRTEASPDQKLLRKNPSSIITSKTSSKNSSKYYQKSSFSQKKQYDLGLKKYFIQQVRAEINNSQSVKSLGIKMSRKDSQSTIFPSNRKKPIEGSLPKILKISTEKISNQGIYQSLKHFANYDYIVQERKIKDIIGLSNGEDDDYIGAYLKREVTQKQQKNKERSLERAQKRKKLLQNLNKKQQHCKRYHAHQVQPYMRF